MKYDILIISAKKHAQTALKLAEGMRKYRLPKGVTPQNSIDYKEIYLDTEETPFDENVKKLLDDAGYIIVLFSPEAHASNAINDRLVYYEKVTGRESIVPVIVDGEPADIFPPMFIQHQRVSRILPDMSIVEMDETIEPVAADLRGDTEKRRQELLQYETVRITASVLGLHPDDLERRHQRRRKRRLILLAMVIGSISLMVATVFTVLGVQAMNERNRAIYMTELATCEMDRITSGLAKNYGALAKNPECGAEIERMIDSVVEKVNDELREKGLEVYIPNGLSNGGN